MYKHYCTVAPVRLGLGRFRCSRAETGFRETGFSQTGLGCKDKTGFGISETGFVCNSQTGFALTETGFVFCKTGFPERSIASCPQITILI